MESKVIVANKLTFHIGTTILVKTQLQAFYITSDRYSKVRLSKVKQNIIEGKITNLDQLATACGGKIKWTAKL